MANHCIDCEFCGRDQRSYGDNCCKENIENEKQLKLLKEKRVKDRNDFLSKYGITRYNPEDALIALIKRLETMDCQQLKLIETEERLKQEKLELLRKNCNHRHPDGSYAINHGFAEADDWCSICGQ